MSRKPKLSPKASVLAWQKARAKATKQAEAQRKARLAADRADKFCWDLRDVSEGGDVVWDKVDGDE